MAAKQYKSIGELAEKAGDLDKARKYYTMAAEAFETEDSQTSADKLKIAVRVPYGRGAEGIDTCAKLQLATVALLVDLSYVCLIGGRYRRAAREVR